MLKLLTGEVFQGGREAGEVAEGGGVRHGWPGPNEKEGTFELVEVFK